MRSNHWLVPCYPNVAMNVIRGGLFLVLAAVVPAAALAQSENRVAVGASVSPKTSFSPDSRSGTGVGFLWRIGEGREGWGWKYGLGWYSTDIDEPVLGQTLPFGKLRIRPILGGYGYTHRLGRTRLSANLMGGYSFNSFNLEPRFDDVYRSALTAQSVATDVSNAWVIKPEISSWIDLSPRVGLNISAGYAIVRPEVTISSTAGSDTRRIRGDMFILKVGAVYSVF